mgnify:CR=1 FL=1
MFVQGGFDLLAPSDQRRVCLALFCEVASALVHVPQTPPVQVYLAL